MSAMRDQKCPDCGVLMFKVSIDSRFDIEIACKGMHCRQARKLTGESTLKRLTYPNPISVTRRTQ